MIRRRRIFFIASSSPRPFVVALAVLVALLLMPLWPRGAGADGVIVVEPPVCDPACPGPVLLDEQLVIRSHRVDVAVKDQVATTKIGQVFHNPNPWAAEGTYIFPIPDGAAIGEFTMWVDGEPVEAKLLDAAEARRVYNQIVRDLRDPALLEYIGTGAIQASIFPIPPGEDRRIEIEYGEVLTAENGLTRYRYGLNSERFSALPLEQVSVRVSVESDEPIRAVYSPSHDVAIDRPDDRHLTAGWEASDVRPDSDFELFYSVAPEAIGANLVSYWDTAEETGYFMLLAAPGITPPSDAAVIAKDVIVVLDTSGSMEGEKIVQAKAALSYVLEHLNPEDRFGVVEFSTGARQFSPRLEPASEASGAVGWVERLAAEGGTDINLALLEALAMTEGDRPTLLLFLTDGLPTEGEIEVPGIIANVDDAAPDNVRLFAFGVGDDVDTLLLDSLAQAHAGRTTYVRPGEALDEAVSGFYAGVSTPVLADLEIDFGGATVEDVFPTPLPDLFAGGQLVALGRYREGGAATLTISGQVNGQPQTFVYDDETLATSGGEAFLPRLWATRKIGYLLNQIRLNGENPELVQSVVDLSVRFGIVTPYTSYLITEDDILSQAGRERAAGEAINTMRSAPAADTSGAAAVDKAQEIGTFAEAEVAAAPAKVAVVGADGEAAEVDTREVVRTVGARTFVLQKGVWTETTFDSSAMETTEVAFASDDYFRLIEERPELAEAFALGERVIAVSDGEAFEVTA